MRFHSDLDFWADTHLHRPHFHLTRPRRVSVLSDFGERRPAAPTCLRPVADGRMDDVDDAYTQRTVNEKVDEILRGGRGAGRRGEGGALPPLLPPISKSI